ncbi:MAG: hypothetical protein KBT36_08720 [Kurthia sp.]|nr:hypothetical protein [Candidatus Kurthia equi]
MFRPNLARPEGKAPGGPSNFKKEIKIVAVEDIAQYPARDENGIRFIGDFLLKNGANVATVYHTSSKADASWESSAEPDAFSREPKFVTQHPGGSIEALEFMEHWTGKDAVIFIGSCDKSGFTVEGSPCTPMQLVPSFTANNDGTFFTLTWQADGKTSKFPGYYDGNLEEAQPVQAASNALTIDGNVGRVVQLASVSTTAAITFTALENLNANDRITLIGGGGTNPYTLASGGTDTVVVLKNGTSWTGLSNATITLKYFDAGAKKYLIEENRK